VGVISADVARQAGVSVATVSYVVNDTRGQTISAETRENVLRIARELGYRPSAHARSLRRGRGSVVLCPLPSGPHGYVLTRLMDECAAALEALGYSLVRDARRIADPEEQLDAWMRVAPAGVIDAFLAPGDPVLDSLRRAGIAVLSAALKTDSRWETTSDALAREVRVTQLRYLLDRGARRIAMVLPPRLPTDRRVEQRALRQWRSLARNAGGSIEVVRADLDAAAIRDVVAEWKQGERPEAVAAYNDEYAIAIVAALIAAGVRVPRDVAVIGVDDMPMGRVTTPTITTLGIEFDEYARAMAAAVRSTLEGAREPALMPVPRHYLIERESA
jgi:DNA-binding LacI/PurR family transcriptional regulator